MSVIPLSVHPCGSGEVVGVGIYFLLAAERSSGVQKWGEEKGLIRAVV